MYRDKPASEDCGYEIGGKIKFWIYVTDTIGHSRVQPSLLGEDRECGGNQAYHPLLVDSSTCSFCKSLSSSLFRPISGSIQYDESCIPFLLLLGYTGINLEMYFSLVFQVISPTCFLLHNCRTPCFLCVCLFVFREFKSKMIYVRLREVN